MNWRACGAPALGALAALAASLRRRQQRRAPASSGQMEIGAQCQSNAPPASIELAFVVRNTSAAAIDCADVNRRA